MKQLVLMRHAKSSWDDERLDDHDRPLAPRGHRDAPRMGKRLARRKLAPDLLLTSMALALGRSAVAVVLSGAGHDGATGATAVRHLGGVVVTSDAESSAHFSMPKSTIERDQIAPAVLPLSRLVAELPSLVQADAEGTPLSGEAELET